MYITGLDPDRRTDEAEFELGTLGFSEGGKGYLYVQANGSMAINLTAQIGAGYQAIVSTTETPGSALALVGKTAFSDEEYGWVQVYGIGDGRAGWNHLGRGHSQSALRCGRVGHRHRRDAGNPRDDFGRGTRRQRRRADSAQLADPADLIWLPGHGACLPVWGTPGRQMLTLVWYLPR